MGQSQGYKQVTGEIPATAEMCPARTLDTATGTVALPGKGVSWTAHPVYDRIMPPITDEQMVTLARKLGVQAAAFEVQSYRAKREELIQLEAADPLRYGFDLPHWKDARSFLSNRDELVALGGNGSAKTEFGGKLVNEIISRPNKFVLCVTTNEDLSKQKQQAAVNKYLPPVYRRVAVGPRKRNSVQNVNYSQKGGFTENTFVLANRSQVWFKTVEQYLRAPTSFEGPEYDLIWLDEPVPIALLNTLRLRAAKRAGKIFLSFTAVSGFDAVCADALTGAKLVRSFPIDYCWPGFETKVVVPELTLTEELVRDCPRGHMPYLLQPLNPRQAVICFWTHWNMFLPWQSLFDKMKGKPKAVVKCRLFGWAEKMSGTQFPAFNPNVHVVPVEKVPAEGSDFMADDPAIARSHFILWCRVDHLGRKFIFDESPRYESEGEWVNADGERGDGQRMYAGKGVDWYREYIRAREEEHRRERRGSKVEGRRPEVRREFAGSGLSALGSRPISSVEGRGQDAGANFSAFDFRLSALDSDYVEPERVGDPRAFATQSAAAGGGKSLFELYEDGENPMFFRAAPIRQTVALDIEIINDWLSYDDDKDLSVENEPKLFISERCQNLIRALSNWNPEQGGDSPWKDPIDTLRYLAVGDPQYSDPKAPEVVGGRGF